MANGWNRAPLTHGMGRESTSVSAAFWQGDATCVSEVTAEPDRDQNIITLMMSRFNADDIFDGRVSHSGTKQPGMINMVRAGERPRGIIYGPFKCLHLYLPQALVSDVLATDGHLNDVELFDPASVFDPVVQRIGNEVLREIAADVPLSRLRIDLLGQELAIHWLRTHSSLRTSRTFARSLDYSPADATGLRRVRTYLEDRLGEDVDLPTLAVIAGVSPRHLTALFQRATGLPPHRWLMRRRVERACELLLDPRRSITDIAHACGFSSSQHLATRFRAQMGCTPSAYQRERTW